MSLDLVDIKYTCSTFDIHVAQKRLARVARFAFPETEDWEETASIAYRATDSLGYFWVSFTLPQALRKRFPGGRPEDPVGRGFWGVEMSFLHWPEVIQFVHWLEDIKRTGLIGLDLPDDDDLDRL